MATAVGTAATSAQATKDITSLRTALAWLDSQGDVLTTDVEVDPDLEVTGVQKHLDGGPVLMFNRVKGKPHARAITNLLADMMVVDKLFGFADAKGRTKRIAHAMTHPITPVHVSQEDAPCQEEQAPCPSRATRMVSRCESAYRSRASSPVSKGRWAR
jgi:4-hydroxy-3-polyprenylbenzoate decarboxylase